MRAASQLLSSLSSFPATRRAWRRDAFELLLDPAFFSVDVQTLRHWRDIIDNLMSHDKDAFRELLSSCLFRFLKFPVASEIISSDISRFTQFVLEIDSFRPLIFVVERGKDVFELKTFRVNPFLPSSMSASNLFILLGKYWSLPIVNRLTEFRSALGADRVSVNPSGSLGLFSSKEQEIELRAMLLKRLAFTLFCTEGDQYQRYLPDIQGLSFCLPNVIELPHNSLHCFQDSAVF